MTDSATWTGICDKCGPKSTTVRPRDDGTGSRASTSAPALVYSGKVGDHPDEYEKPCDVCGAPMTMERSR